VVVVSAYGDMPNIRAAMNAGAFDFIGKPIDFVDLDRTIRRCASNAIELRKSLASQEENGILRVLLGSGAVDRFVNVGRSADLGAPECFDATVVCIGLPDPHTTTAQSAHVRLAGIRAHFDMTIAEMSARQGSIAVYTGETVLVLFKGPDHVARALDASCCLVERMRSLQSRAVDAWNYEARVGVAAGEIVFTAVGSRALGRVECVVLGEPVRQAALLQSAAAPFEVVMKDGRDEACNGFSCSKSPSWPADSSFAAFRVGKRHGTAPLREAEVDAPPLTLTCEPLDVLAGR
jgi:class 3 adenylate cyclase